ncbi:hypothetical protein A2467_03165 [Candidatus Nomurabacteria bacterium RIFOXYC2_FULL_36_8]|nr:MAG: hypothetical protein A2467_03165 [Candidatus Nomurabacteria bacterium RIFOXYC2_FULL_36_8]
MRSAKRAELLKLQLGRSRPFILSGGVITSLAGLATQSDNVSHLLFLFWQATVVVKYCRHLNGPIRHKDPKQKGQESTVIS